jgi:hypothetical protein
LWLLVEVAAVVRMVAAVVLEDSVQEQAYL